MSPRLPALLLVCLVASFAAAKPRPINEAERAAVAIVARYLDRGPTALHAALTDDAPLRTLPAEEALREIAARTGPAKGATWKLQTSASEAEVAFHVTFPSGYDDALLLRMKETDRGWLLHELRTIGEPHVLDERVPRKVTAPPAMIGVLALLVLIATIAAAKRIRFAGTAVLASVALLAISIASHFVREKRATSFIELRDAALLREALARGESAVIPEHVSAEVRSMSLLWVLQSGHMAVVQGTADDPFSGLGPLSTTPLGYLVRARISDDRRKAAEDFHHAAVISPLRDDLLSEAASTTGEDTHLERLIDIGSRDAATYYEQARRLVARGRRGEAGEAFRMAWDLEPIAREELLRDEHLSPLLQDVGIQLFVGLFDAHEPLHAAKHAARTPLPLPPNATSYVLGSLLRVSIGTSTLEVPAGVALAPRTARVVPATQWQNERTAADLRDAESLIANPSAIRTTSPVRLIRAADLLSDRNRWKDVLTLTAGVTPKRADSQSPLLVARIRALTHLDRDTEAHALVEGAGVRKLIETKADPLALIAIAEAMTSSRSYDAAAKLYDGAMGTAWESVAKARRDRIAVRQQLLARGLAVSTQHFAVRYLDDVSYVTAERFGRDLEIHLANLQQQLPAIAVRPITVNILQKDDFRAATGSKHILGMYDGELVLRDGGDAQTVTHELVHALIAQLTRDHAPRWFQEGMAERLSSTAPPRPQRLLPVALLDPFLENTLDEHAIEDAYKCAHLFVRFLEQRYGAGAIVTLIREFAEGKTTEEALRNATGKSAGQLHAEMRASVHKLAPVPNVVRQDVLPQPVR
jgi:hypothetical protein